MFHTRSFRPHLSVVIPGRPQGYMSVSTVGQWGRGSKDLGLNEVVSRGRNLRPCHEFNVDLDYFYVLALVNSAAVNMSTSVFFRYCFLRVYAQ